MGNIRPISVVQIDRRGVCERKELGGVTRGCKEYVRCSDLLRFVFVRVSPMHNCLLRLERQMQDPPLCE